MNYYEMYSDVWKFHKKFIGGISEREEYWQAVVDEGDAIAKKYGNCKFIINLLLAETTEFERLFKEMKQMQTQESVKD